MIHLINLALALAIAAAAGLAATAATAGTVGIAGVVDAKGALVGTLIPGGTGSYGAVVTTVDGKDYAINIDWAKKPTSADHYVRLVPDLDDLYFQYPFRTSIRYSQPQCTGTAFSSEGPGLGGFDQAIVVAAPTPAPSVGNIVFDGTSLTFGRGGSNEGTLSATRVATVMQGLGPGWSGANRGVAGQTLQDMINNLAAVNALYDPTKAQNILIAEGGHNDFAHGASSDIVIARIRQYVAGLTAAHPWRIIWATELPASYMTYPADFYAKRDAVNAYMRANWQQMGIAALSDVASDAIIGPAGAETNTTYYSGDRVHLADPGYSRWGAYDLAQSSMSSSGYLMFPVYEQKQYVAQSEYIDGQCYGLNNTAGRGYALGSAVNITNLFARPFRVVNVPATGTAAQPQTGLPPSTSASTSTSGFSVQQIAATFDGPNSYCRKVTVRNDAGTTAPFVVTLAVQGTVTNATNAAFTQAGQSLEAKGLSPLAVGASTNFDFCANR